MNAVQTIRDDKTNKKPTHKPLWVTGIHHIVVPSKSAYRLFLFHKVMK